MERSWIFLINPFIVATNNSYSKMKQIGDVTLAAIAARVPTPPAEDIFTELFATLSPLVQAYDDAYTTWLTQQGATKGQTQTLNDLLDDLSSQKIEDWDLCDTKCVSPENTAVHCFIAAAPHTFSKRQPAAAHNGCGCA